MLAASRHPPGAVVADKADDTKAISQALAELQAQPIIPPESSRNQPRAYNQNLYADCNKEAYVFAMRYDETASSFLAAAHRTRLAPLTVHTR